MDITYTQHSVAFPTLPLAQKHYKDEIGISLHDGEDNGTLGEMHWTFMDFDRGFDSTPKPAIQMCVFGDGLACLADERVQNVIAAWKELRESDAVTAQDFIGLLEQQGIKPSQYHLAGIAEAAEAAEIERKIRDAGINVSTARRALARHW